jgi:thiamine biosynthesis protein ThiI
VVEIPVFLSSVKNLYRHLSIMETDHLLVRYGEIGTKSQPVKSQMIDSLRQRVEDRLEYEDAEYGTVSVNEGRIIVDKVGNAEELAGKISETPGVVSASPAKKTGSSIEEMKETVSGLEVGETFGVRANHSGKHEFDSQDVDRELGDHIRNEKNSEVDLDDPETWVQVDIRFEDTYIFTEKFEGPDGVPVGFSGTAAALISGGIDSPVSAHEIMKRGVDIIPVYFYNKPVAAEDHYLRFRSVVDKLKRFHPAKDWKGYKVDMEEVNRELMDIGKGRMVLHRRLMFAVAEKIARQEGLNGLVTGESLSQKSSQTSTNLKITSRVTDLPIHRPLLTHSKNEITDKARELGTFEDAKIASACSTMAPKSPSTEMDTQELNYLEEKIDFEELVDTAMENAEKIDL